MTWHGVARKSRKQGAMKTYTCHPSQPAQRGYTRAVAFDNREYVFRCSSDGFGALFARSVNFLESGFGSAYPSVDYPISEVTRKLMLFRTGFMTTDYYRFPRPPYKGRGWKLGLRLPAGEFRVASEHFENRVYPGKEVVVRADSAVLAQKAGDLVHGARLLLEGSNVFSHLYPGEHVPVVKTSGGGRSDAEEDGMDFLAERRTVAPDIPLACLIAARISWRVRRVYALAKLRLSLETFSLPFVELDPHRRENVPKSPLPDDHVCMAYAIVAAYSSIEELGLEIRASSQNPSRLGDGSWNPRVKEDLERRLRQAHVNLDERFLWNLRGPQTRIEMHRAPDLVRPANWARYRVRDGLIEVIDAINYVSFLRSKVAAHRSDRRFMTALSVYDVANAQFLARRLLLESVGYWRYWRKRVV